MVVTSCETTMKTLIIVSTAAFLLGYFTGQDVVRNAPIPPGWTVKEVR